MLNHQGEVAECSGDNIFLVNGKHIRTPHASSGILKGITRDTVIELSLENGYTVAEETLTPFDIYTADECFLTGTAAEVIGMVSLDANVIGEGKPGPVTRHLMELYAARTCIGTSFSVAVAV